jgi:hypothetical protein
MVMVPLDSLVLESTSLTQQHAAQQLIILATATKYTVERKKGNIAIFFVY